MKYNELTTFSPKRSKRAGRGISSGQGKTAGRGTKGQRSRAGSGKKIGFEGGQNPLMRRLPKLRGFKSHKSKVETVYTGQLASFANKTVGAQTLVDAGLISSPFVRIKLLVKGELDKKVTVKLPDASKAAIAAVEKAGGSFEKTEILRRASKKQASV